MVYSLVNLWLFSRYVSESNRQPVGHVVDVVGAASDPGIEVQVAVRTHDLPYEFSEEAIAQARAFGDSIDPTIAERERIYEIIHL